MRRFDVPRQGCLPRRPPVYELLRTHQRVLDPANPVRLTCDWSKPIGDHVRIVAFVASSGVVYGPA